VEHYKEEEKRRRRRSVFERVKKSQVSQNYDSEAHEI
jgi:hypothetical protein